MPIAIQRADGGISIMRLIGDADAQAEIDKWKSVHPGEYVAHVEIDAADIPADKSERAGWVIKDGKIEVDPIKADPRDYRAKRKEAYIKELGKVADTSFENTTGDMLDIVITQLEAMRLASGVKATDEYAARIAKIAEIKQRFPKA